jgi:hypothetical protein
MAKGRKTGGRRPGSANKITRTVKEVFEKTFRTCRPIPKSRLQAGRQADPGRNQGRLQSHGDPEHQQRGRGHDEEIAAVLL